MKQSLLFFFKYYLFWFVFFVFFRAFFLIYNYSITATLSSSDLIGIFTHGSIMDLSAAGYLSVLPGLVIASCFLFFPAIARFIIKYYTLLVLLVVVLMGLGDAGLFIDWGSRLNNQIILYLQNPGGMYAAMSMAQIITLIFCWFAFTWGWFWLYKKIVDTKPTNTSSAKWISILVMVILTAALILPIRGGVNTSPLNHSHVYFSENLQANQSAYNYFWNFFYSITKSGSEKKVLNYMPSDEAERIVESSHNTNENYPDYMQVNKQQGVNVIFVLLESFSNKIIAQAGGLPNATPRLNELAQEGILFTNIYATGNRSDKGICGLIGAYPAVINGETVLAFPDKMDKLYYFPQQFKKHGYDMSFYYGGDVNFYNLKSTLLQAGFSSITSNTDFTNKIASLQKWGVPDEFLYARMIEELQHKKQPFFSMVYTISSHEPFDVPYQKIKGTDDKSKYLNSIAYSDSCLGIFIDQLKSTKLWENSLVIISSDHSTLLPEHTSIEDPITYRIPLLFTGGVIDTSFICQQIAMQNDIGPTLIQQMGWKDGHPKFSKNIFSTKQYAFYCRETGWGFVSPSLSFFQNIESKKTTIFNPQEKQLTDSVFTFAKAYIQYLHDDFNKD